MIHTIDPPVPVPAAVPGLGRPSLSTLLRLPSFVFTGTLAGCVQIVLLSLLVHHGWHDLVADVLAALVGAELNFVLSSFLTWRDRVPASFWKRWLLYHGTIAGTMLLSLVIFTLARTAFPDEAASALGILLGGVANFVLGDRLVFRHSRVLGSAVAEERAA